jgi:anaerobic selenocysteine-containing dehydrogenase
MNPDDIRREGLQQGQIVDLASYYKGEERIARRFMVAPFTIPRGCTATYFPEGNVLVPINSTADRSNTPTSKSIVIRVTPSGQIAETLNEIRRNVAATRA